MPLLLTESLDGEQRELTHQHIENCPACLEEWQSLKESWRLMGELPEVEVPARVRKRFLDAIGKAAPTNVVPFSRRPAVRWVAQAAAVAVLVGGAWWTGHRSAPVRLAPQPATLASVEQIPLSIAETRVLPATAISPNIQGRPNIQNVQFVDTDASDKEIGVSFDITSRWTVTGSPSEKSMVRLLTYLLGNEQAINPSRSGAIEWVRRTYSTPEFADPEIATALAKVLRSDSHEGVRIRAVDTLGTMPASVSEQTREALIEALKSDPNPSVRIKAVEALANMARSGGEFDPAMVDTLRQKAAQDDENLYVRVKAAELLSNIRP
jgi:hypothetical protein